MAWSFLGNGLCQRLLVKRPPHFDTARSSSCWHHKIEAVLAAAQSGTPEVVAIAVCERLSDQAPIAQDIEAYRRFRMIGILRPAGWFRNCRRATLEPERYGSMDDW